MKEVDDDVEEAVVDDVDTDKRNDRGCCCWRFIRLTEFRDSTLERERALAKESTVTGDDSIFEDDTIVTIARSTISIIIRIHSILLLLMAVLFDPMLVLPFILLLRVPVLRKGLCCRSDGKVTQCQTR